MEAMKPAAEMHEGPEARHVLNVHVDYHDHEADPVSVPAPHQQTCQSPKREPSVTALCGRRNLGSNGMCFYGHHIHHFHEKAKSSQYAVAYFPMLF
jgi:hypothetical protein